VIPFERNPERPHRRLDDLGGRLGEAGPRPAAPPSAAAPAVDTPLDHGAWLIGPLLLASVAAGMVFVFRGVDHLFGVALGVVLGLGFLWVLVSVLFPAKPDRTCPGCGRRSLERIDPKSTHGLCCTACDWLDEEASGFLLAEEEGSFEDVVLRERRRRW